MKKIVSVITALILLCSAVVFTLSASAAVEDIVGYSAQRVEKKDLTNVPDILTYNSDAPATEYKITSIDGWNELAYWVNDEQQTFKGITVYLAKNIYPATKTQINGLGGETYDADKNKIHLHFAGTFDGQGYTIENVTIKRQGSGDGGGLFAFVKDATIKNLILGEKCTVSVDKAQSAGIVGRIQGVGTTTIDNCWNKATVTTSKTMVGGIAGIASYDTDGKSTAKTVITNCTNSGSVSASERVGGIIGRANGAVEITNCLNTGAITATDTKTTAEWISAGNKESTDATLARKMGVAGILGETTEGATSNKIEGCINTGTITGSKVVAGIVGFNPVNAGVTVNNCANYGKLELLQTDGKSGQIVGQSNSTGTNILSGNLEKQGETWTPVDKDPEPEPLVPDAEPEKTPEDDGNDNSGSTTETNGTGSDTEKNTEASETTASSDSSDAEIVDDGCGSSYIGSAMIILAIVALAAILVGKRRAEN